MKIIKPYGQTTVTNTGDRQFVGLDKNQLSIIDHSTKNPRLVMAQWIAMIDKIIRKPSNKDKDSKYKVSKLCLQTRAALGKQCLIKIKDTIKIDVELEKRWNARLHPYEECDKKTQQNLHGRWYDTFYGSRAIEKLKDCDHKKCAEKIYQHLYEHQYSRGTDHARQQGTIFSRANSISKNTHKLKTNEQSWNETDECTYKADADIACIIYQGTPDDFSENNLDIHKIKAYTMDALYQHYAQLFGVISIKAIPPAKRQLFSLHTAIRKFYCERIKKLYRLKSNKVDVIKKNQLFPKTLDALLATINAQKSNRELAYLIRLGKVIHYQASLNADHTGSAESNDSTTHIVKYFPSKTEIAESVYWTTVGQTEIKRNEAFVRIWRGALSFAQRSLTDWANSPTTQDILTTRGKNSAHESFDKAQHNHNKKNLLIGKGEHTFNDIGEKQTFELFRLILADLRHNSFHFKGQEQFLNTLSTNEGLKSLTSEMKQCLNDFCRYEQEQQNGALKRILQSIAIEHHVSLERAQQLISEINSKHQSCALPRLSSLITRVNNVWLKASNSEAYNPRLKQLAALQTNDGKPLQATQQCQYTLIKLLYRQSFSDWLAQCDHEKINDYIHQAVTRANTVARNINKDRTAVWQAADRIRLTVNETFDDFMDQLRGQTTSAMRTQHEYYQPNSEKNRNLSQHLEGLRCDVIAHALVDYLQDKGFLYLLEIKPQKTKYFDLDNLQMPANIDLQPWQQRLYLVLHLIPVEEVNKLRQQLIKWSHNSNDAPRVMALLHCLDLYIDRHDAQFMDTNLSDLKDTAIKDLYIDNAMDHASFTNTGDQLIPIRGLREMLRFAEMRAFMPSLEKIKITSEDVERFIALKKGIESQQDQLKNLHVDWVNKKNKFNQYHQYKESLHQIINYRQSKNHIYLYDHLKAYRISMQILARLTDYAGLWERDLYFVTLALFYQNNLSLKTVCKSKLKDNLKQGKITKFVELCLDKSSTNTGIKNIAVDLTRLFWPEKKSGQPDASKRFNIRKAIRNNFAHFNMLSSPLGLTQQINKCRLLVSYDHKLKNAVTQSIKQCCDREGLEINWALDKYKLSQAKIVTKRISHLGNNTIKEDLNSAHLLNMLRVLFND